MARGASQENGRLGFHACRCLGSAFSNLARPLASEGYPACYACPGHSDHERKVESCLCVLPISESDTPSEHWCWGWANGAFRSGYCLKREGGKYDDLAERPKMNGTCVHEEEIQRENKIHFYCLPTGAANTEGLHFLPPLINASICLVGRSLSSLGSPWVLGKYWNNTTKDTALKR